MKICHACRRPSDNQMRFCDGCGAPQTMAPMRTAVSSKPLLKGPSLPKLTAPLALLLVGLIVGVSIGGALFSRTQIQTVSQQVTTTSLVVSTIQPQDILEVCYSPGGRCADHVIFWINKANSSLHVLIYSFTFDDIRNAVINARNRGVEVKIVIDDAQARVRGSEYMTLKNVSIDVRLGGVSGEMHDKFAIIDQHIIVTGSFNWSANANGPNSENLLVIDSRALAAAYEQHFQTIYQAAAP